MKKKFNLLCGLVFLSYLFSDGGLFAARVVNSGGSRSPNSRSSGRTTSSSSSSNSSDISGSVLRFLNSVHLDKLYYDESYSLSTMLLPSVYNYYYTNGTAKLDEKFCFGPYMKLVGMDSSGAMDVVSAEGEIKCVDLLPKYSYSVSLLNGTNSQISSVVDNSGLSSDRRKLYVTRAGNLIASMYLESEIFVDVSEYEKKINSAVQTAREKCGAFVNDMEKLKSQITYGVSLTSGVGSVLSTGSTVVGALSLKNTKDAIYYDDAMDDELSDVEDTVRGREQKLYEISEEIKSPGAQNNEEYKKKLKEEYDQVDSELTKYMNETDYFNRKSKEERLETARDEASKTAKDFDKWQVGLSAASSLASGTASVVSFVSLATIEDAITNLKQCEDSIRTLNNAYSSYNAEVSGMED